MDLSNVPIRTSVTSCVRNDVDNISVRVGFWKVEKVYIVDSSDVRKGAAVSEFDHIITKAHSRLFGIM